MTTDDAWVHDTGPTFVVNRSTGERRGVDWPFNGWGGLHGGLIFPWDRDDLVASKICELEDVTRYPRRSSWRAARSTWTGRAPA